MFGECGFEFVYVWVLGDLVGCDCFGDGIVFVVV